MVNRTPNSTRSKVIQSLLSGDSYSQIAKSTGIGKSTVSSIARELESEIGKRDTGAILLFAKSFKKAKISLDDAFSGARTHALLKRLELDDEESYRFLSEVFSECQKKGLEPYQLVQFSLTLFELSESAGISPEELPDHCRSLEKKRQEYQSEIAGLEKEAQDAKKREREALNQERITNEGLVEYRETKKRLGKLGLSIDDATGIASMLEDTSKLGFDARTVIDYTKREQDFEERIGKLEENLSQLDATQKRREKEAGQLDVRIKGLKSHIEELSGQKERLKEQIDSSRNLTMQALNEIKDSATSAVSETAESAKVIIESARKESENGIDGMIDNTKGEMKNLTENFKGLLGEVSSASEEVGRMEAILPLHKIMSGSEAQPSRVYLSMLALLDGFKAWQAKNPVSPGTSNHTAYLRENIQKEIEQISTS